MFEKFVVGNLKTKKFDKKDFSKFEDLCKKQKYFFDCMQEDISEKNIRDLFDGKPSNAQNTQKVMFGFFENNKLAAVLDLISEYPNKNTVFINLFMVNADMQRKGFGREIINKLIDEAKKSFKFNAICLGVIESNLKAKKFWDAIGFKYLGIKYKNEKYNVEMMDYKL